MLKNIKPSFNHLKIHTQYSICEGALQIENLAKYCKVNKIRAAGLCDSNNLCGALEFSELLAKSKTQPIIGTQININYGNNSGKLPLFAKDLVGYKNLIKLSSKSFLSIKDDEEPHCSIEDLEKNSKGLIILSGCFDGFIGKLFYGMMLYLLKKRLSILTCSISLKDNYKSKLVLPSEISNIWLKNRKSLFKKIVNNKRTNLLYIGRVRKEKGCDNLINLFNNIKINSSLSIVGNDFRYLKKRRVCSFNAKSYS